MKFYRPHYDTVTGNFLELYETLGYIVVRGDKEEHFLDYRFCKQNSKIWYSYHKKRIPSSFSGTFFNLHKIMFETGRLQTIFSNIFCFLPSTTDRSEYLVYLVSVNLLLIDCPVSSFETKENVAFDPSKLDFANRQKEIMTEAVVEMLTNIADMSMLTLSKMQMHYYPNKIQMLALNG